MSFRSGRSSRSGPVVALMLLGASLAACINLAPPFPEIPAWSDPSARPGELGTDERELWNKADEGFAELEASGALVDSEPLSTYLAGVLARLWPDGEGRLPALRVHVMEGSAHYAVAFPNGVILISSGFLASLADEAQLAFLLGHELAHVLERHALLGARYEALTGSHVDRMKLSRKTEADADRIGFDLLVDAGYDPAAAAEGLHHLRSEPTAGFKQFRSWESHADLDQRVRSLQERAREHPHPAPKAERYRERFLEATDELRLAVAALDIEAGNFDRARRLIDRYLRRNPGSGRAHFLRGELARRTATGGPRHASVKRAYERAIELVPEEPDALRALGLLLRDEGARARSNELLRRYLQAKPDAIDRKLIERYIGGSSAE